MRPIALAADHAMARPGKFWPFQQTVDEDCARPAPRAVSGWHRHGLCKPPEAPAINLSARGIFADGPPQPRTARPILTRPDPVKTPRLTVLALTQPVPSVWGVRKTMSVVVRSRLRVNPPEVSSRRGRDGDAVFWVKRRRSPSDPAIGRHGRGPLSGISAGPLALRRKSQKDPNTYIETSSQPFDCHHKQRDIAPVTSSPFPPRPRRGLGEDAQALSQESPLRGIGQISAKASASWTVWALRSLAQVGSAIWATVIPSPGGQKRIQNAPPWRNWGSRCSEATASGQPPPSVTADSCS